MKITWKWVEPAEMKMIWKWVEPAEMKITWNWTKPAETVDQQILPYPAHRVISL